MSIHKQSHSSVDQELLFEQKAAIVQHKASKPRAFQPIEDPSEEMLGHPSPVMKGRKVGCVVMAGGLATRLGNSIPKGVIPFSCVAGKPLLQILAEKVLAFGRCYGATPSFAVMTSEETDGATKELFQRHHFFGLPRVEFFVQESLPLLDMEGRLITQEDGSVLKGPDGNGGVFAGLVRSGIAERWREEGVEALSVVMVDNPLVDPFCPALFAPIFRGVDLSAAAIERKSEEEKVGVFAKEKERIEVVEYSELESRLALQRDEKGRLTFKWANISCFACSVGFVTHAAKIKLPLHAAKKIVKGCEVWKSEYFVFDAMAATKKIQVISLPRDDFFAPVKDKASFEEAKFAMVARDRRRFFELTGKEVEAPFELTASAYYPTSQFLSWLRGCTVRRGLVEEPASLWK